MDTAQRFVVIRCLRAQCESGQLLVDLFVNYDCDLEGQNLFERMVLALVRLAQGNVPQDATAQVIAEEQAMRLAVSCAVSAYRLKSVFGVSLGCIVAWTCRRMTVAHPAAGTVCAVFASVQAITENDWIHLLPRSVSTRGTTQLCSMFSAGSAMLGQYSTFFGGMVHSRHAHRAASITRHFTVCGGGKCAILGDLDLHCAKPTVC